MGPKCIDCCRHPSQMQGQAAPTEWDGALAADVHLAGLVPLRHVQDADLGQGLQTHAREQTLSVNSIVQLSTFLIDLFVGTYRLSSHARLEAFVIQTKLN